MALVDSDNPNLLPMTMLSPSRNAKTRWNLLLEALKSGPSKSSLKFASASHKMLIARDLHDISRLKAVLKHLWTAVFIAWPSQNENMLRTFLQHFLSSVPNRVLASGLSLLLCFF